MKHNMHLITSQRVFFFFLLNLRFAFWEAAGLHQSSGMRTSAAASFLLKLSQADFCKRSPRYSVLQRSGHLHHVVAKFHRDGRVQGGQRLEASVM